MSGGQSIVRGIVSNWAALGLSIVISFFLSPFVVNKLGSVYYGIWALTLQFTSYLHLLDFGVRESVVRYTAKYCARNQPGQLNAVLTTAALTYLPIILFCLLITGIAVWAVPGPFNIEPAYYEETRWAVLFTGLTITQSFFFNIFLGVLQGLRRYDLANGLEMGMQVFRVAAIVALLSMGFGLVALSAIQFGAALLTGMIVMVIAIRLLKQRGVKLRPSLPKGKRLPAMTRRIVGYGFYSFVHSIAQKIVFSSDVLIVGMMMAVQSVTFYSIAATLTQYLKTLVGTSAKVFLPVASEMQASGRSGELSKLFLAGAKLNVLIAMPIALTLAILGTQFVGLWMGPSFTAPIEIVLPILAVTQILSSPHNVVVNILYGISRHAALAWLRLGEAAIMVALSLVLARSYGLMGVALGQAIPHVILVVIVLPYLLRSILGLPVWSYIAGVYMRPVIAAVPFALGAWWVRHNVQLSNLIEFGLAVALLLVLYAPCVYAIGLTGSERQLVLRKLGLRKSVPALS
ncbi:MAG TPA: oligosaccharide flippase family protein [Steroidobacter sp.]|uniref:oligosaccharide flippase family protein n=1 Tax=Steroidobacter sp. TaxID=1978227 RepID=UPI002ED7F0AA